MSRNRSKRNRQRAKEAWELAHPVRYYLHTELGVRRRVKSDVHGLSGHFFFMEDGTELRNVMEERSRG